MDVGERPELVVALDEQRVVGAVEREPGRPRLGRELVGVVGEERELSELGTARHRREGEEADVLGGGLCNVGTAVLSNATIAANVLSGVDNDGQLVVRNTILAENAGTDCSGVLTSHGFNLFRNPSGCLIAGNTSGDLVGMDPALGLLEDNGGPTPTHALLAGSAALDTGNPAAPGGPAGCESTDQRGVSRPQGFRCDIGAFEASACGNGVADAGEACEDGNLTDGDGVICQLDDGLFAVLLEDCDRRRAVAQAWHVVDGARIWKYPAPTLTQTGLSVSIGLATLTMPPRNFPAEELLTAAERCLSGVQLSGGDGVKSIDIY